jgi:hypothetical protein
MQRYLHCPLYSTTEREEILTQRYLHCPLYPTTDREASLTLQYLHCPLYRTAEGEESLMQRYFHCPLYPTTDREESLMQRYLHCRVCLLPWASYCFVLISQKAVFFILTAVKLYLTLLSSIGTHSTKQKLVKYSYVSMVTDKQSNGDAIERGSFPRPSWSASFLRNKVTLSSP